MSYTSSPLLRALFFNAPCIYFSHCIKTSSCPIFSPGWRHYQPVKFDGTPSVLWGLAYRQEPVVPLIEHAWHGQRPPISIFEFVMARWETGVSSWLHFWRWCAAAWPPNLIMSRGTRLDSLILGTTRSGYNRYFILFAFLVKIKIIDLPGGQVHHPSSGRI